MVVYGRLWSFAGDMWLFTGGLWSFPGGLWSFVVVCGGLWSLPVLAVTINEKIKPIKVLELFVN